MRHIRAASQFIEQKTGQWIPSVETRYFEAGHDLSELMVPPLISVTSLTNNGTALSASDYTLEPPERCWPNGPYSSIRYPNGVFSTDNHGIVVSGMWGRYSDTEGLGVQASLTDSETTVSVSDGSKISPGMVLLIDAECVLVEATGTETNSTATLGATITADDTAFTISDGSKVKIGEVIKIGGEKMKVADINASTIYVERGWNETRRESHTATATVWVFRQFAVKRGCNGTTAAAHTNAAVYRYVAPWDVNYLCRNVAALMLKKAETGFIGRSGNDDLGTGFWVNEFPKNQVEAVQSNYFWPGG